MSSQEQSLPIGVAKARFAECIRFAEQGRTIVLTRHGRPVARLAPFGPRSGPGSFTSAGTDAEVRETAASYDVALSKPATEVKREALERLLETDVWPRVPAELIGKGIGKHEREEILGLGKDGA